MKFLCKGYLTTALNIKEKQNIERKLFKFQINSFIAKFIKI